MTEAKKPAAPAGNKNAANGLWATIGKTTIIVIAVAMIGGIVVFFVAPA